MKPFSKNKTNTNSNTNTNSIKKIIFFNIIEFFLIILIVLGFYLSINVKSKRVVYIPKGSTAYIISYLNKNNYSLTFIDKYVINYFGYPQSGWIDLKSKSMKKLDFLYKLTHSKAALRTVTLIPGETYYYFLKEISKKLNLPIKNLHKSYFKYAYKLDGNILPQTYSLPLGMKSDDIILYLMNYASKEYKKYSNKIFGKYNKKDWYKYITIASIIQKESASKEEMPIVSSVIYNRLKKKMKLQMDGTLNYGKNSHLKVTSKMIKNDTSSYNTYKINGLPKNPVCAVEFEALKSAIFPKKTDFLYFMKSVKGDTHIFTNSYKKHVKIIKKVQNSTRYKKYLEKIKNKNKKLPKKTISNKKLHKSKQNKKINSTTKLWQSVY